MNSASQKAKSFALWLLSVVRQFIIQLLSDVRKRCFQSCRELQCSFSAFFSDMQGKKTYTNGEARKRLRSTCITAIVMNRPLGGANSNLCPEPIPHVLPFKHAQKGFVHEKTFPRSRPRPYNNRSANFGA